MLRCSRRSTTVALAVATLLTSPLRASSTGGSGKSMIQSSENHSRSAVTPKREEVAARPNAAVKLTVRSAQSATESVANDSSMGGSGGGHSVIQKQLGPFYLTGDYYLAPGGNDNNPCTFTQPCRSINHMQSVLTSARLRWCSYVVAFISWTLPFR